MKTLARPRDRDEILSRLARIHPGSERRWGTMTAHQMVCHLSDAFRMAIGAKLVSPAGGPIQRTITKWVALYTPLPWPPGIVTRPEIAQGQGGTCPDDFTGDVADLVALVEVLTAQERSITWPEHPIFGRLSDWAWLRWAYLHMDHHLRQFNA
jgi:Protein of unknown function (DUF1569)